MRRITEIIIHCTATRPDFMQGSTTAAKVAEIKRWHVKDRGWSDIGYHYLIDRDGTIAPGRPIERDGAHVKGRNKGTIGISLFGGHGSSENDAFAENFTSQQDQALRRLIRELRNKFGDVPISGHNEYAAKACPGFQVRKWYNQVSIAPTVTPAPIAAVPRPQVPKEVMDLIDETEGRGAESTTTMVSTVLTAGGPLAGLFATLGDVDPMIVIAIIASVTLLGGLYIMRSRSRKARKSELARMSLYTGGADAAG